MLNVEVGAAMDREPRTLLKTTTNATEVGRPGSHAGSHNSGVVIDLANGKYDRVVLTVENPEEIAARLSAPLA